MPLLVYGLRVIVHNIGSSLLRLEVAVIYGFFSKMMQGKHPSRKL